jgi:uncharacterized protein
MDRPLLLARWLVGSHAYGVADRFSDKDYVSLWLEPPAAVTGLASFDTRQTVSAEEDETRYGLREWSRLVTQGNPNMIETLFITPCHIHPLFSEVLEEVTPAMLSSRVRSRFAGYASSQIAALEGRRNKKTNRPGLIAQHGWDTKWGYHAVRVAAEGLELVQTGRVVFPLKNREFLRSIREGAVARETVIEYTTALVEELQQSGRATPLPDAPDYDVVNKLLHDTYITLWR